MDIGRWMDRSSEAVTSNEIGTTIVDAGQLSCLLGEIAKRSSNIAKRFA